MNLSLKELLTRILRQGEFRTLLWENPSPTSAFPAQTLTVPDMSGYDYIEMDIRGGSAKSSINSRWAMSELTSGATNWAPYFGEGATGLPSFNGRPFHYVSSTQIYFGSGAYWNTSGSAGGNNVFGMPYRIYGIKIVGGGTA